VVVTNLVAFLLVCSFNCMLYFYVQS